MRRYKAESFDKMQYLYGAAHDPLIHGVIWFSEQLDIAALKRAVTLSLSAVPMLRCCFELKAIRPHWADRSFTGEDIVTLVEAQGNESQQIQQLLSVTIDIFREPQLKLSVLRKDASDTLCVIVNHMVCDGAGLKEYLYLLAGLYTKCADGEEICAPAPHSRGTGQLFKRFRFVEKARIFFLKYDTSILKDQCPYRFEGNPNTPFFLFLQVGSNELLRLKTSAKQRGVTFNDLVLCAYIRVLHRRIGGGRIVMPCPVDLRRYLPSGWNHGICNLTSNYICDIAIRDGDTAEETLMQVLRQMQSQKESLRCLKAMISMEMAFRIIPFFIMKSVFGKAFVMSVVSYTNLGVIDRNALAFRGVRVADACLTGAVKRVPNFQVSISTFDDRCTLSCNMFGTPADRVAAEGFLCEVRDELMSYT